MSNDDSISQEISSNQNNIFMSSDLEDIVDLKLNKNNKSHITKKFITAECFFKNNNYVLNLLGKETFLDICMLSLQTNINAIADLEKNGLNTINLIYNNEKISTYDKDNCLFDFSWKYLESGKYLLDIIIEQKEIQNEG